MPRSIPLRPEFSPDGRPSVVKHGSHKVWSKRIGAKASLEFEYSYRFPINIGEITTDSKFLNLFPWNNSTIEKCVL